MRKAADSVRSWSQQLMLLVPYVWLAVFFLAPFVIVFKISLSQTVIAQPPYTPLLDLAAGWQGLRDFRRETRARHLSAARVRPDLSVFVSQEPEDRRHLHRHPAADRLSDRLWHRALAAPAAAAAGHGRGAAVLDLVPDPRLCLDQYFAARRVAQRRCCSGCTSSTRRWRGCRPTPRSISAWSIPICRSWCCRSMQRWRKWTRRCWKPPPISAAPAAKRSGG